MPAVGAGTARRDSASVRRATRALTAQQVGWGTLCGVAPVGWGRRTERRGQNNSQFGCNCSLSVATVFKSITIDEVTFRMRAGSPFLGLKQRQ